MSADYCGTISFNFFFSHAFPVLGMFPELKKHYKTVIVTATSLLHCPLTPSFSPPPPLLLLVCMLSRSVCLVSIATRHGKKNKRLPKKTNLEWFIWVWNYVLEFGTLSGVFGIEGLCMRNLKCLLQVIGEALKPVGVRTVHRW